MAPTFLSSHSAELSSSPPASSLSLLAGVEAQGSQYC